MGKETIVFEMEDKPKISGVTTADIESIQVYLCLKDGRLFIGKTDNQIIKNIMATFVQFAEVNPELIHTVKMSDVVK